jgi:predicted MFS family arabinose efflux permease
MIFGVLTSLFNFLDRSVLNILAEPIKQDLGFSDTQLGLLTGFAFALFYSLAGLPIARYVDRPTTNRPIVIAICMVLWSGMTMVSGMVTSYAQMLVARILVAIGESGGGPAVLTLINHYVSPANRSRAFGIYGLGVPMGTVLGLVLGGWLVELVGWRMTFLIVGAPGVILALLIWLFLYEPRENGEADEAASLEDSASPSLRENVLVIRRSPALLWLSAAASVAGLFIIGVPSWTGVYLIRVLDLSPSHAGVTLGLIMGFGGALGTYFGGAIADRISTRDPGRALLVPCAGLLLGIPAAFIAFLSHDWRIFAGFYFVAVIGVSTYIGPLFSILQLLVSQRHRATTTVIVVMLANLIGAGLGPFLIGIGSDYLNPHFGIESLRWVLVACQFLAFFPAFFYFKAGALAGQEIENVL